jgi:hypothetical protein
MFAFFAFIVDCETKPAQKHLFSCKSNILSMLMFEVQQVSLEGVTCLLKADEAAFLSHELFFS